MKKKQKGSLLVPNEDKKKIELLFFIQCSLRHLGRGDKDSEKKNAVHCMQLAATESFPENEKFKGAVAVIDKWAGTSSSS